MQVTASPLPLTKRFPLTISRGTTAGSENLLVAVEHDGITGFGEMAPFNIGYGEQTAESGAEQIADWAPKLVDFAPWQMQGIESMIQSELCGFMASPFSRSAACCALDFALHDWEGKRTGRPVWQLLGGDPAA